MRPPLDVRRMLPPGWLWRSVADRSGLSAARLVGIRRTTFGYALQVRLDPPATAADVARSLDRLAVGFGAARCVMKPSTTRADQLELFVHRGPPAASVQYPADHRPVFLPSSPAGAVPLGLDDEGDLVALPLLGRSLLIAGSPGSGKSNVIRCVLASQGLSGRRNLALVGIDPKRVELALWRPRFAALVEGNEAEPALDLLAWLVDEVQRRAIAMSAAGLVELPPSHDYPAVVLVVDEWAEMAADGTSKQRDEAQRLLRRFISLGRATGCSAVLATQRPTSDTIDTGTRALLAYRLALRSDRYGSEATLGTGHCEASSIAVGEPGRGFITDGADVRSLRLFDLDPGRITEERCAGLRVPLEGIPHQV